MSLAADPANPQASGVAHRQFPFQVAQGAAGREQLPLLPFFLVSSMKCFWIYKGRILWVCSLLLFLKDYQLLRSGFSGKPTSWLQGMFPWFTGASPGRRPKVLHGLWITSCCIIRLLGCWEGLPTEAPKHGEKLDVYGLSTHLNSIHPFAQPFIWGGRSTSHFRESHPRGHINCKPLPVDLESKGTDQMRSLRGHINTAAAMTSSRVGRMSFPCSSPFLPISFLLFKFSQCPTISICYSWHFQTHLLGCLGITKGMIRTWYLFPPLTLPHGPLGPLWLATLAQQKTRTWSGVPALVPTIQMIFGNSVTQWPSMTLVHKIRKPNSTYTQALIFHKP